MNIGSEFKNVEITKGNAAPHVKVFPKLQYFKDFHTGYCIKGLVMVARLT